MRKHAWMKLSMVVLALSTSPTVLSAQPPRKLRAPSWHIEPTEETLRKVENLIGEVRDAEISINVQPNRSRLIHTKQPILRISITNPRVMDVIQYSPTELELIGLRPGLTTMTIWFQSDEGPPKALRFSAPVGRQVAGRR